MSFYLSITGLCATSLPQSGSRELFPCGVQRRSLCKKKAPRKQALLALSLLPQAIYGRSPKWTHKRKRRALHRAKNGVPLSFSRCLAVYFLSKLSQHVQLSVSQLHVLPTWIFLSVQKSPARLYLHSVTPQPIEVFTSGLFSFIIIKIPPWKVRTVYANLSKTIDIFKIFL